MPKGKQIVKDLKKKTEKKLNITLRLPESVLEKFDKICKQQGVSKSDVAEELIRRFNSDFS